MALARINEDRTLEARVVADEYDSVASSPPVFFFAASAFFFACATLKAFIRFCICSMKPCLFSTDIFNV